MGVLGLAALTWFGSQAAGQVVIQDVKVQVAPAMPAQGPVMVGGRKMKSSAVGKEAEGTTTQYSAIKLTEKSEYRRFIEVARDCIKGKEWNDAVTALQVILDNKEDFYVQVRDKDARGNEFLRWTSVKYEANNLLGSMAEDGLNVYELRFGAKARAMLEEAKAKGDRDLLGEVGQRFLHTLAGIEANDLLATYFLDRGQFFMAALRFEKLLGVNPERTKLSDLTLFKAALAYRRAGDVKNSEAVWAKLEPRLRERGGMQMGDDMIAIAKLQAVLEEIPRPDIFSPHDWAMIRGNKENSAQAKGTPPLLDSILWKRALLLDKSDDTGQVDKDVIDLETAAARRVGDAVNKVHSLNNLPVMSGFYPIAVNRLLIYRTYTGLSAVYLHDEDEKDDGKIVKRKAGEIKWRTFPLEATLASILSNGKLRGYLDSWLDTSYFPTGSFSSILYENSTLGALSCDHRLVYAVDDLAVPPPGNAFQPANNPFMQPSVTQLAEGLRPLVMQNSLCAFDLESGRAKWQLGDPKRRDDPFNDSHFLGVPISIGGKLYVLNEKNSGPSGDAELRLICIDPTKITDGRPLIVQTQSLGNVQQQARVTHDVTRRVNAVHLGYGEGILVCPTNAGEVLGVDLTSRSLAWAYPYREQSPQTVNLPGAMPGNMRGQVVFGPGGAMNMSSGATIANWKSSPPVIVEGKVVFTAPDATSVHCINLRDGTSVWKKRQMDGDLFLAGVFQGKAIVVGRSSIRALDIHKNGDMTWYQATGDMPAGQGVASKNIYYLPLKKGEILAIDIENGQVKAHNKAKDAEKTPLGNLVFYEGAVIAQTPTEIVAFPQLQARLEAAVMALRTDPENAEKLVNRGELYLADGQVQKAVDDLQRALSKNPAGPLGKRTKTNLYEALTQLLQTDFVVASGKYLPEYAELCKVGDDAKEHQQRQARYFRIVGQGREAQGNLVEAFQMYREFGSLPIHRDQGGIAVLDDPTHRVPVDVWLRGRVSAMFAKATADQRAPLEKKIVEEWKSVEVKKDANAIRSFVGMFDVPFPVGREARIRLAESIIEQNARNDFLEAELNLQQLRTAEFARDAASGGRALAALAALEEKKGTVESMKQAAGYYRELAALFPNEVVRDGKTGSKLLDELATDKRFLPFLAETDTLWGDAKIAARELSVGHSAPALQGFSFQPEGDLTPFMKRHRLILDPTNAANPQLRLVDLTGGETRWTTSLGSIPMNFQFFQYLYQQKGVANNFAVVGGLPGYNPNHRYRYYQVKGHLVVFQVGTQVYCLDANDGKMLWQQPLAEQIQQGNPPQMFVNQVSPDAEGRLELILINQFNGQRTRLAIGSVGSVQASHAALLTQKGLVVLDPLRGTTLWKKMDVPAATHAFGDDQYLFVVDNADGATGAGRTFRASDGTPLDLPDFGTLYQHRVRVMGRRILAAVPSNSGLTFRLYDIPTAKDVWTRTFEGRPSVLQSEDPSLTGIVEANTGKLVVLDVATGKELMVGNAAQHRITADDLKNLKDPLLLADRDRFYVALSQPVDGNKVGAGALHNNFTNGVRCFPVNGWIVAFHRKPGKTAGGVEFKAGDMAWHSSKKIENQMMVLEQFELLPVMLFSGRHNELIGGGAQGNRWVTATLSLHKANGKLIFDSGNRPSNSNAQFDAFNLDLKAGTINMIGYGGTLQHYIDDGRKVPLPPGATTMTGPPPAQPGLATQSFIPAARVPPVRLVLPALPAKDK
jgi:outer membrane protein assembly factor BamB